MTKKLENLYLLFKIDFKQAGSVFFFPAIMWLVSVLQLIMQNSQNESDRLNSIILFQGIYLPFAGWGLMYRLKEIYEDGASETLFPYYRSNLIIDISRYLSIHFIGTMIWCLFFSMKYSFAIIWPIHMIHFFLITLLFMFLGYGVNTNLKKHRVFINCFICLCGYRTGHIRRIYALAPRFYI
ncbi:hypothetical protein [Caldibacillus debilis]|uniref:Uncharacterized protein n=1 Tax=Caldibacillus debilis GB1 TaxID=1339248 RepID=A0A420VFZ6_9BACI|nr:hypothetical protein [Caldibacillus debilis]RKO62450.1 hypothetical protein Cdeb_03278 [Caldibacillus debilis GB1]